jgi:L-ascorbate metabolism protein UlaG (beta-lactamase superfamily)
VSSTNGLIRDIDACEVPRGALALWWLGQQGFAVKAGPRVLHLDAFLSPHPGRRIPPLLAPEEITGASFFFGSHDHRDHIDRGAWPALARALPQALFVVPDRLLPGLADDLGVPRTRFLGLDDGATVERDGVAITGIAAAHELLDRDPVTGRYACLGYVIESNGCTLYHAGDGCIYGAPRVPPAARARAALGGRQAGRRREAAAGLRRARRQMRRVA